jgi:radical SAM superfamily enzyme YgiQ (UPF0313 family)
MIEAIALVNMCYPKDMIFSSPPLGLLSISNFLNLKGIQSNIYDISIDIKCEDFTIDNISKYLSSIKESIIGISTWDAVLVKIILSVQNLKQHEDKIIILGGPTISNLSQPIMDTFYCIDYCVEGEGEIPMLNLIKWINSKQDDISQLSSKIIARIGDKVYRGNQKDELLLAENIPSINYELFNVTRYERFEMSSSRGCPFRCEFCSVNSTLDNKIRIRPIDNIFEEIDSLFKCTKADTVNFVDDNFGLINSRLKEFCTSFKRKYPDKKWTCYFRLSDLTKENVDLMSDSGCIGTFIGIETGNKEKQISIKKNIDRDDLLSRIKYATSKFGVTASFIWGFPDEDEMQLLDTFSIIEVITEYENIIVDLFQLSPLSGTPLTKKMMDSLIFDNDAISGFIFPPHMPKLSKQEEKLICKYPHIFSAFYHEDTTCFGNKFCMVNKFTGKIKNKTDNKNKKCHEKN